MSFTARDWAAQFESIKRKVQAKRQTGQFFPINDVSNYIISKDINNNKIEKYLIYYFKKYIYINLILV